MKNIFFGLVLGLSSTLAFAATEYSSQELSCRAKAKEVAAESYKGCVSEFKNAEIERLHKNYQKRLKALKENYEKEVEALSPETQPSKTKGKKSAKNRSTPDDSLEVKSPNTAASSMQDDSTMDLPEPVPVEN